MFVSTGMWRSQQYCCCGLIAVQKDPLIHTAVLVLLQFSIEMRDRLNALKSDKLSRYGQDDLAQLVFDA